MSTNVTETDDYSTNVPTPALGDRFTYPATVTDALTKLASRTKWLANTLAGQSGSITTLNNANTGVFDGGNFTVPLTTRGNVVYQLAYQLISTIRFVRQHVWGATESTSFMNIPVDPVIESDGGATQVLPGTYWTPGAASDVISWTQASVAGAVRLWWFLRGLPPAGKINLISCQIDGAGGHGALPATKPVLSLFRHETGQAPVLETSITDAPADVTAYQAEHALTQTNLEILLRPNCRYFFRLEGETGANSVAGLKIISSYIGITHV